MAQSTSYSMSRGGRETSFLSFDDAPNSPNPQATFDSYATQHYDSITTPHASSSTQYQQHRQQPASPDYTAPASGSNRSSPSNTARQTPSRPSSSKHLASAVVADASDALNRADAIHASPPRAANKPPSSRGSRLGALFGRSMQNNNDGSHSSNASSSTNHTDATSSNDSSFFGRRNRNKALPQHEHIDEMPDPSSTGAGAWSSNAARSSSAMDMLDFKPDSPRLDNHVAGRDDARNGNGRPARPSSQSNLSDKITAGAPASVSSSTAPQQHSRGGRLGRLAYKKEDSIAFIAQSRNASQQTAAFVRNNSLEDADRQQCSAAAPHPTPYAATHGLGIEDPNGSYTSEPVTSDARVGHRCTPDYNGGLDYSHGQEAAVGVASSAHTQPVALSSNTSSRAPSVAGTHGAAGGYHNRFSRQGLSQQLAHDSSADSAEARATRTSASRSSYDKDSSSPRGTLSDAAIAVLGAMPGASSSSLLNPNGAPLSSKNILTIALQKAQNAVQLDSANNVPDAISAYKQAVRLLEEVMERIAPRNGKRSRPSREEERRRLRVIHDTYADRIRLLSMIYSPEELNGHVETTDTSFSSNAAQQGGVAPKADWLDRMRDDSQHHSLAATPRMDGGEQQQSPREDARSFLSITPVRTAFPASSPATIRPGEGGGKVSPIQTQHPWPRSPPMQNEALSPSLDSSPRRRRRDHRRPGSRGSRRSRASISLSIADEQEAPDHRLPPPVIAEEMPSISIEAMTPNPSSTSATKEMVGSPKKTAATQLREEEVQAQQHGRSDSDSSYQSTTTGSRLKPTATMQGRGAFGLDDHVRTPVTPYFDATGDIAGSEEREQGQGHGQGQGQGQGQWQGQGQGRGRNLSLTSSTAKPKIEPPTVAVPVVEKPAKMGLAQRARALSFKGPLLRQKASMPSLGGARKEELPTPMPQNSRPGSAGSPTEPDAGEVDHPTPWDVDPSATSTTTGNTASNLTLRSGSNRPRASTASALVSASTAAGTISQRRKVSNTAPLEPRDGELDTETEGEVGGVAMSNRQRSTSQPGSRRPSMPAAFIAANSPTAGAPPVPNLARTLSALELKRSAITATATATGGGGGGDGGEVGVKADGVVAAEGGTGLSLAMPLPRFPATMQPASEEEKGEGGKFLITDIFPSGLPSLAAGRPSYYCTIPSHPLNAMVSTQAHPLLKPFTMLSSLQASLSTSSGSGGSWLTPRLFIPSSIWRSAFGLKLISVETKLRSLETLTSALDGVERGGAALLMPLGSGAGLETSSGTRFVKVLEEFEVVMGEIQNSLARKLPFIEPVLEEGGRGGEKKGFGSRFTRGLDRMTGGGIGQAKALDSTTLHLYVDALSKLFSRCQILASHLKAVLVADGTIALPPCPSTTGEGGVTAAGALHSPAAIGSPHPHLTAYSALPSTLRQAIFGKLRRASQFHAKVVLRWVLQDLGLMLERVNKRGSGIFVD
ncbi:uncharacterized protein UDID_00553 [Ustilago sp. UG-2017a]|nr:uncharacterized protein UDID_00553 [Ustilago sp. UG-2017a]